jgi:uncharacterized protein YigE (DUF2233 family)
MCHAEGDDYGAQRDGIIGCMVDLSGLRSKFAVLLIAFACAPAQAVTFERVESEGLAYTVARVDLATDRVEMFPARTTGNAFRDIEQRLHAQDQKLTFAMNAGMYHPDFSAVGLLVVAGRQLHALNTAPDNPAFNFTTKPNGVFVITANSAHVVESSTYGQIAAKAVTASQSGPALVLKGKIHPRFRPTSTSRRVRNGVGVTASGMPVFVISESAVTLFEFASLFRDRLACPNALYFDGTVSSLHAPALHRSDSLHRLGPIIGVVE